MALAAESEILVYDGGVSSERVYGDSVTDFNVSSSGWMI